MSFTATHYHDVKKILDEAYDLRVHDLSQSIILTEKALKLSKAYNIPALRARGLSRLALYKMIRGEDDESLRMSNEAIEIYTSLNDERGTAIAKYSLASLHYKSNNYQLGMVYLLDCLISFKNFKDYHNESRTLKSLGTIYELLNDYKNAMISYEAAVVAAQNAKDSNLESNAYNPMSGLLLKQGDAKKAMELITLSITLKTETNDQRGLGYAIYGRGKVHRFNEHFEAAEIDFLKAIDIHDSFGDTLGNKMARYKIARLYVVTGRRNEAMELLQHLIKVTLNNNLLFIYLKATRFLSQLFDTEGDAINSLKYLQLYIEKKEDANSLQVLQVVKNYERAAIIKSSEKEIRLELEKTEILIKKDRAEQNALVKQDFLSAMSHEIRTPLNAVTGIISLLENRSSKEDQELLNSLRFSSKNLLRIIDDILDFSKLESNNMQLDKHPVCFDTLINNIKSTYVIMAKEKGVELKMKLSADIAPAYSIDETKLFQILGNLLSNAIKYTNEGSVTISIEVTKKHNDSQTLRFKVEDTGVGIPQSEIDKLFDNFYIPKSVTTRDVGGTGLGLAIVKRMVNLHKSVIKINSIEGQGSIFFFDLILDIVQAPKKEAARLFENLRGKTALLAEDNEINALVIGKLLEKHGLQVSRAKDGEETLKLSHENKVDFILMDIHMPKLNGFETAKIIRTQNNINSETPIFALTADITAINKEEFSVYFDDFLRKPIEVELLFTAFSRAIKT